MSFNLRFFPFKDFVFSIIPTVASYQGYLQEWFPFYIFSNQYAQISIGLIISFLFGFLFYYENVRAYKKSLSEILATGYFMNFSGKLFKLLKGKNTIHFLFPQENVLAFSPEQVVVEAAMPSSLKALKNYCEKVEAECNIVYIREASMNEPYWVWAKQENNLLTIYEYPRTLFALSKYLKKDFSDAKKAEKSSKKLYAYFNAKIEELKVENSSELALNRIKFISL
jgi:hypothetical protein